MSFPILLVFTFLFRASADGESLHPLLAKPSQVAGQRVDLEGILVVAPGRERLCARRWLPARLRRLPLAALLVELLAAAEVRGGP